MSKQAFFDMEGVETYGDCSSCGLFRKCNSPQMDVHGDGEKKLMIIGEAPGAIEDEEGLQFVDKSGKLLQRFLTKSNIDMRKDCWTLNAVNCRPIKKGKNRAPTSKEISCCRGFVLDRIKRHQPYALLLLGKAAVESVIGHRWPKKLGGLARWVGLQIPDTELRTWICPTYDPSFVMREENSALDLLFSEHIEEFYKVGIWDVKPPLYNEPKPVSLDDESIIIDKLNEIEDVFAFDYETNTLKPEKDGARILTISFCHDYDKGYAFDARKFPNAVEVFKEKLRDDSIPKIAHNFKFEERFSEVLLETKVRNWYMDTMLHAHCEDGRKRYSGLKFQTYIKFGISGYDKDIEPYMKEGEDGLNKLEQAPVHKVLEYNALDSIFTYRLAMEDI